MPENRLLLKVVIVSWYFPPVNTIGALRVGQFARFLAERGHDFHVIAGTEWGHPETLSLSLPLERIHYAKSLDVNAIARRTHTALRRYVPAKAEGHAAGAGRRALLGRIGEFYQHLTNVPDKHIGWLPSAYHEARKLTRDWLPDIVFASGPPFTAALVAKLLSRRIRRPWLLELRDRWADDPYDVVPAWRARLDQWTERRTLDSATGLVTVSEPWAEFYRSKYAKPVTTIYNGYNPDDFKEDDRREAHSSDSHLVIGYTGKIYPGRRDPTPLFEALHRMGTAAEKVRIVFVGTDPYHVLPLAEKARVRHCVEIRPEIPYAEALAFQQTVDVLLLMQWNDPREQGSCPGKLFEYIASLRPILLLGLANGVPATIIKERGAGFCLNDPGTIAEQLSKWQSEKEAFGRVSQLPSSVREGLSRTTQFIRLEQFLMDFARTGSAHGSLTHRNRRESSSSWTASKRIATSPEHTRSESETKR